MARSAAHKDDPIRRATYQDVLDAPAHLVAEVLDGTLHTQPRPAMPHGLATLALGTDLSNPFQFGRGGPGGWWIASSPSCTSTNGRSGTVHGRVLSLVRNRERECISQREH